MPTSDIAINTPEDHYLNLDILESLDEEVSVPHPFEVPGGMAKSVWESKYSRKKGNGEFQSWSERVTEVVKGNFLLQMDTLNHNDYTRTMELALKGVMPFSGRHLQHGDVYQPMKSGEIFTNCSTAMLSFLKFLLLLKGSGVGRDYSSDACFVNWDNMPNVRLVLDEAHPDYTPQFESLRSARHIYDGDSEKVRWFEVADSAEGWVKVVEILETAAYHGHNTDKLFIFDFSKVRAKGEPIRGAQDRPSSGPIPFMETLVNILRVKNAGMPLWKQAMFVDHYLALCVAIGGIRRAARIACKSWKDKDVIEFIDVKRGGWLHTANNSVLVDEEFWEQAREQRPSHGRKVFEAMSSASYFDKTGEPGFINIDKLTNNKDGLDDLTSETVISKHWHDKLSLHKRTDEMIEYHLTRIRKKPNAMIVNPCSEIPLSSTGGYCVIGDICLANSTPEEAMDAAGLMSKFLIRVNTMPMMYEGEVKRTNRIGVSLTGIHEFAFNHYGLTWDDITSDTDNGKDFWNFIAKLRVRTEDAASTYSEELGLSNPHTVTTIKPSGTISKVMGCTEGAHLPAAGTYTRWVQFSKNDPNGEIERHRNLGYPVRDLAGTGQYEDSVIIGFPTKQALVDLMGEDLVVTADAATPSSQYRWLKLLEKYWFGGEGRNSQASYTLHYKPENVSYTEYMQMLLDNQSEVKCCSIMPLIDMAEYAYAYVPMEVIDLAEYNRLMSLITVEDTAEAFDESQLACDNGVCPIEPTQNGAYSVEASLEPSLLSMAGD